MLNKKNGYFERIAEDRALDALLSDELIRPGKAEAAVCAIAYLGADGEIRAKGGTAGPAKFASVFDLASITKSFTAITTHRLMDRLGLTMNAPLGEWLPDLPPAWAKTTAGLLLGHRSGLPLTAFCTGISRCADSCVRPIHSDPSCSA